MKNQIFKNYIEFLQRLDKTINGFSQEFVDKYQIDLQINCNNVGCWNCLDCSECVYCDICAYCINCINCNECDDCVYMKYSYNCNNCRSSEYCKNSQYLYHVQNYNYGKYSETYCLSLNTLETYFTKLHGEEFNLATTKLKEYQSTQNKYSEMSDEDYIQRVRNNFLPRRKFCYYLTRL